MDKAKQEAADADKAKADAKAAYDAAVKDADVKKQAAADAQLQIAKGSLGFFESRGSEDAVKVLTDPATTKYLSSIELGKDGDARKSFHWWCEECSFRYSCSSNYGR